MQRSAGKLCPDCNAFKPLTDYHMNRAMADGRQHHCKTCQNRRNRESRRRSEESGSEEGAEVLPAGNDLYVMTNPRIPGEYKVGRSKCVEQRRECLQNGQNFKIEVMATFPGVGWAEGLVHDRLAHSRVHEGAGRE